MSSHGIRDRVAIVGMGCTRFAEHFDKGVDDLLREATDEAFAGAGVTKQEVDAYWMRCPLIGPHEKHENSETGATWSTETGSKR